MPSTQSLSCDDACLSIVFEPMIDVETALPFAYQASVADAGFDAHLARIGDAAAIASDTLRATLAIRRAVEGGLLATRALLAVPVSTRHADPAAVVAQVFRAALAHRLPIDRLVILVSADEGAPSDAAIRLAEACDARALAVAFDRFAMGPVGVRLLARFTPRFVTLDTALVHEIEASAGRARIIESVLRLARRTGIALAAPGVRSPTQLAALCALGVRFMQGSWIAAPAAQLRAPETASPLPRRAEPRRLHANAPRRDVGTAHRRLQHHRRSAAAPRDPATDFAQPIPAFVG